jgi:hypothetical protein
MTAPALSVSEEGAPTPLVARTGLVIGLNIYVALV